MYQGNKLMNYIKQCSGTFIVPHSQVKETLSPNEELVQDIISILRVFSCRLYGLRKYKKQTKGGRGYC